jgi:hypothetical protein
LLGVDLTAAVTLRAGFWGGAFFRAASAALGAGLNAGDFHGFFAAFGRFFKRYGDAGLNVLTAPRRVGVGLPTAAETAAAAEKAAEDIASQIHAAETAAGPLRLSWGSTPL